jgi:vitamin B12 transporter
MPRYGIAALLCSALTAVTAAAQQPVPLDTLHATAGSRLVAGAAATRSIEVIDRARIEALPARSVLDVVARALGVDLQARSPAQADLAIRGAGFEQVLVMVDGVPVNDDQTGHFHLDLAVPLDAVERIEVLRGPASALYGSAAVGGVVNIVTRAGGRELTARAQGGSFGAAAVGVAAGLQRTGTSARVSADWDRADGHRPGTDHDIIQARAAVDHDLAGGSLRAHAGWAARDFGANAFYAPFDSYEETRALTASLGWLSAPATLTLEPRVSFRQHEDDFILVRDNPALYRNEHRSRQTAGELVARWAPPAARVRVAAGTEAAVSTLASNALGDRREDRLALFGEVAAGDAAGALLTTGLRFDRHSTFGSHLSPSIAAGIRVAPRLRLRASAGSGFRAPSWTDRYYADPANIGNPDLDAETFWTAELGARLTAATAVQLDVSAFVRHATGMIDWARPAGAPESEPWRTMNVERARFTGLESSLTTVAGPVGVTLRGSLLSVRAETDEGLTSKYALRPLTRTLAIEAAAPIAAGFAIAGRGALYRRAGGDGWHLVDARVSRDTGRLQLFLDMTNPTGAKYADVSDRPAAGRAWGLGGRVRR